MALQTVNLEIEISNEEVVNGTKNFICSEGYMERLVKISVVNILFHRLPIPENIFVTKEFNSIPYRTIKMECVGTGIAQLFRKWMKGFKDAFRKKYLKEFILFFTDNSQSIQENFKFKFQYEGRIDKAKASTDLTEPTESMLKSLIMLGDIPKLHKNIHMHVELFYYQGTPEDYMPPLFDSKDFESTLRSKMNEEYYEASTVSRISTGFHYFVLSFKRKANESQFLRDTQREPVAKRRRKNKSSAVAKKGTLSSTKDKCASAILDGKRSQWNISDTELMQSLTSIDLTSGGVSRAGISFDMDYADIPNEEDIDIIAEDILSLSK